MLWGILDVDTNLMLGSKYHTNTNSDSANKLATGQFQNFQSLESESKGSWLAPK